MSSRQLEDVCFVRGDCRGEPSLSIAQAQIMIDMSRITCSEYFALPPNQARMLAAWMSGWFNQKMGYVWVDLDAYTRNVANVRLWCETYPDQLVMNGLQRATGK